MRVIARVLSIEKHESTKRVTLVLSNALDVLFFFIFLMQFFFSLSIYLSIPHHSIILVHFLVALKVIVKGLKDNLNKKNVGKKTRLTKVLLGFGIKASLGQGYKSNFKVFGQRFLILLERPLEPNKIINHYFFKV
jgi:hypothetical protein